MSKGDDWVEVLESKAIIKISQALRELHSNEATKSSDGSLSECLAPKSNTSVPSLFTSSSRRDSTGTYWNRFSDTTQTSIRDITLSKDQISLSEKGLLLEDKNSTKLKGVLDDTHSNVLDRLKLET